MVRLSFLFLLLTNIILKMVILFNSLFQLFELVHIHLRYKTNINTYCNLSLAASLNVKDFDLLQYFYFKFLLKIFIYEISIERIENLLSPYKLT